MTQQYFTHFNCRRLAEDLWVLQKDYSETCWSGTQWWVLAVLSTLGILFISVGVPVFMWLWMSKVMEKEMDSVRFEGKMRVPAPVTHNSEP